MCTAEYTPGRSKNKSNWESQIIKNKFEQELQDGKISRVTDTPRCIHDVFVVPKEEGGGRVVVDCSRPKCLSINNYTDCVRLKFSYKSLNDVTDMLQYGDFIGMVDIKDVYRAVSIHPKDRKLQGLSCQVSSDEVKFFQDNLLCMGLALSPFIFSKISDFCC